jgi:hypothetical protein
MTKYELYEFYKKKIQMTAVDSQDYETQIKQLADKLGL